MSIWSVTNTNTTTRSNKCELASNPSKSDKISSVMQSRYFDVMRDVDVEVPRRSDNTSIDERL
ncbi:hypothetical protein PILCRDRAFT_7137 [Piloderma croceum F 1598]|uniref:Uncharacterized protein n=1 Tax=Piloderma croceum (strain F 1598) TaxID=765440 RepID=A0A0C3FUS9_PILCF|nr:hypothetical protein PILCRDRAFT_7137 [Piloderma croceum F 1598]